LSHLDSSVLTLFFIHFKSIFVSALQIVELGPVCVVVANEALPTGVERRAAPIPDSVASGLFVDLAERRLRPAEKREFAASVESQLELGDIL
jgi:hypothetical protein